jgi:hypothetical protein
VASKFHPPPSPFAKIIKITVVLSPALIIVSRRQNMNLSVIGSYASKICQYGIVEPTEIETICYKKCPSYAPSLIARPKIG